MVPVVDHTLLVAALTGQAFISSDIDRRIWLSSLIQESVEISIVFQTGIVNLKTTKERHYHLLSIDDVHEYALAARSHWGVESSLHWCLDVTFREDHSRMRADHTAENFCVVRHIVLNVLKSMDDKMSIARRRRHCAYDDDYLEKVIRKIHA